MLKSYSKFMDALEWVARKLIGVLMAAMVVVMCYQVVLRYVFGDSNSWSEELTRYMFIYVCFLGSFIAIRKNSHLQIDFFVHLLKGKVYKWFTVVTSVAIMAFLVYLTPMAINLAVHTTSYSAGLKVQMGYVYAAVPMGCILMILCMVEMLLQKLSNNKEGEMT